MVRAMSVSILVAVFALGAAVLALWLDLRFPRLAPERMGVVGLHLGGGLLAIQLAPLAMDGVVDSGSTPRTLVALFAILLPSLGYCFLSTIWLLKLMRGVLGYR